MQADRAAPGPADSEGGPPPRTPAAPGVESEERGPVAWQVAPESTLGFIARHMLVHRVRGVFRNFEGTLVIEPGIVGSTVQGFALAGSVETGDSARDRHLRSADFLDAARWPRLDLAGEITGGSGRSYRLESEMTIRDVTRPVTFQVAVDDAARAPGTAGRLSCTARAEINRKDFGLRWNATLETGGVLVGDLVELVLTVVARPEAQPTQER